MTDRQDARGRTLRQVQYEKTVYVGGGGGGDITHEEAMWSLPEVHPATTEDLGLAVAPEEAHPTPDTLEVAAALFDTDETHDLPTELGVVDATVLEDTAHPLPDEQPSIDLGVEEIAPPITSERIDTTAIEAVAHPLPDELVVADVTAMDFTTEPPPVEDDAVITVAPDDAHPLPVDSVPLLQATVSSPANVVVSSAGGWSAANNAADFDDDDASLQVTSSGLTQGTSQTSNLSLVLSFPDIDLSAFTSIANPVLEVYTCITTGGSTSSGGSHNVTWAYSLDNGSTWTNWFTKTGSNYDNRVTGDKLNLPANITPAQLAGLQVRCTGTLVSGTGLLIATTRTLYWRKTRVTFTATRTEP